MKPVAVIGGGITGLTAAWRLKQQGIPVTLYEASGRTGGVIKSTAHDGFLAESGPNTILETSAAVKSLVDDLGLADRRMYADPAAKARLADASAADSAYAGGGELPLADVQHHGLAVSGADVPE